MITNGYDSAGVTVAANEVKTILDTVGNLRMPRLSFDICK